MNVNTEAKILVVDDDPEIRELLGIILKNSGYEVLKAENGEQAVATLSNNRDIDLIILDIMMPEMSGTQACKVIRSFSSVPILFLTAKTKDSDKEDAFIGGGDDFITKPFVQPDLLRKVKSLIRRYKIYKGKGENGQNSAAVVIDNVVIDTGRRIIYKDNEKVKMTDKETDLLMFLIKNRGKPWKIEELYENVWNEKFFPSSSNTIMVHILRLRQKIENNPAQPAIIRTIYGKGYQID